METLESVFFGFAIPAAVPEWFQAWQFLAY
jgi:hypothetical protein